ncbi:hypothetical protein [Aquamicrobium sp.]|uniref:hypothetical protein n=1 Tax=Aquamicrobium sp. TaxID=1872579 RepID=UPI0025845346|nr:hypothetical protein [Aquamicrobium sp.]MCK9549193.1 hypothetical protein [Aquamicrobium sp.]
MTEREKITVWISKYALSAGIEHKVVEDCGGDMVKDRWSYFHKGQWHHDRADAVAKAEKMRQRRISSLKKQISKLEAMKF